MSPEERTAVEATVRRIRELNERIIDAGRRAGVASLTTYERMLKSVADLQESAGARTGEWLTAFTRAQASFIRELAEAGPSAARGLRERGAEAAETAARQARRVPGVTGAEAGIRGTVALEEDLPVARYDSLTAQEVAERLSGLSEVELGMVEAYERRHKNRKSVLDRIASQRG
jgi:hypothetical protein